MKNSTLFLVAMIFVFGQNQLLAQNPKGEYGLFALTHATIETITQGVIPDGTVVIDNGRIIAVGAFVEVPEKAQVIDCSDKWIYPGMIDSGTILGLTEIVDRRNNDVNEIGDIAPQLKALTGINPNAIAIPVTRVNGITTALSSVGGNPISPSSTLFPGTAALINLTGYTPDQMYAGFEGVTLNFPSSARRFNGDQRSDEDRMAVFNEQLTLLNEVWDKAEQYNEISTTSQGEGMEYLPELEALLPVLRGETALLIEVNTAQDILAVLDWAKERSIAKPILTGVAEGWRVATEIAQAKVPVIVGPVLALPSRTYDHFEMPYRNPGLLLQAGITVAIRSFENNDSNFRNLPYHAGFAAAYGMGREEALRAITIVPAEIFGVADQMGSIEEGKVANLFICNGDPFEPATEIEQVFINGWKIPMVSRQSLLYEEFLNREPGFTGK